ncbi:MAG: C25 family cysteine peptidase [Thermoplasmatota archaeon]
MNSRGRSLLLSLTVIFSLVSVAVPVIRTSAEIAGDNLPKGLLISEHALDASETGIREKWVGGEPWSIIDLPGTSHPPTDGGPSLPAVMDPIVLPYKLKDIHVIRSDPAAISIDAPIAPSLQSVPVGSDLVDVFKIDRSIYAKDTILPEEPVLWRYTGSTWDEGVEKHHYSVSVTPFDYSPGSGELILYQDIDIIVEKEDVRPMTLPSRAVEVPYSYKEGTQLLIVSPASFLDDLDEYVLWKSQKGLVVTSVSFSTVDSTYSTLDDPSSLWKYIHDAYFGDEQQLQYVLLVGEVNQVPSRMVKDLNPFVQAGEPSTLPADTYFACLGDASSGPGIWNYDNDADWGEISDIRDFQGDVYVSRIAVSSESQARNWASKIIGYEKNPTMTSWPENAGLFGADTHQYYDGAIQCEYLWSNYLDDTYDTKKAYYSQGRYEETPLTRYNINVGFNDGFGIVVYMGHGLRQHWSEGLQNEANPLYNANDAYGLSQSPRLPYITAMSCETSWFDGTYDSIAEGFTENPDGGALAYVGASRTTYGGIGYNEYGPGAPGIQEDILRMIRQGKTRSAEIFTEAKSYYADYWGAYFSAYPEPAYNCWMEHNLLGPAETMLWMDKPEEFSADFDYTEDYYSNITVTVKDGSGKPVAGANVCIYSPATDRISLMETDGFGKCTIPFIIEETSSSQVTITKAGYRPFEANTVLQDTTEPVTTFSPVIKNPNGYNGWYVTDPEIRLLCSEPSATYYQLNGGSKATYKGSLAAPIGETSLTFWSVDSSGNTEPKNTVTVKYDPNVPRAELKLAPDEPDGNFGWYKTKPVLTASLDESKGSPQKIEYWWDRGQKQDCNGTIYAKEGEHTLHVQAVDEAGNRDEEYTFILKVDSISPRTTMTTGGVEPNEKGWFTEPMTIDLNSDDSRARIYYRWDEAETWGEYKSELTPPCGNHTLQFRSEDTIGNIEEINEITIRYDLSPPDVSIKINPEDPDGDNGWYTKEPSVSFQVENPEESFVILYRIDDGIWKEYAYPLDMEEGITRITYSAEDAAGNRARNQEITVKVDMRSDTSSAFVDISTGESGWYMMIPKITLRGDEDVSLYYKWNTDLYYQPYAGTIYPPSAEGEYELSYYCVDEAGNQENPHFITLFVDANPPVVKSTNLNEIEAGKSLLFDLSNTTDGVGVVEYYIDFGDGTNSGWIKDDKIYHSYGSKGTYTVTIKARDAAGHESETETHVVVQSSTTDRLIYVSIILGTLVILIFATLIILFIKNKVHDYHVHHPHPGLPPHPQHHLPVKGHHPASLPVAKKQTGLSQPAGRPHLPPPGTQQVKAGAPLSSGPSRGTAPAPPRPPSKPIDVSNVPAPPRPPQIPPPPVSPSGGS